MKIITMLSLCVTASLSFSHSEILDKTNDDAFTYDYSQACADIQNCTFPATFDSLYKKSYAFFDLYDLSPSVCTRYAFITDIHGIPPCPIPYNDLSIKKYGFSSKANANAYLNILDPIPSPQISSLGSVRSIIFDFNISINQDASMMEMQQNQYMLGFGTKKIKRLGQLTNPEILNIFTVQQLQDSKDQYAPAQPYVLLPEIFKVSKETTAALTEASLHITRTSCSALANEFHKCSYYIQPFMNITQQPNNQSIFGRKFTLLYEHANKEICPQVFKLNFIYLIPIQAPSKIYAQNNQDDSYSIVNQNKHEERAFICPTIPDEIHSIADLEKKHGCQQFKLKPSSSIEININ